MRVLAFPFPLLSHYLRTREILKSLDAEILYAGACKAAERVAALGEQLFPCEHFDEAEMLECTNRFDFSWLNIQAIERVYLSQVEAIKTFKPDLVVSDSAQTAKMACETTGVPHVSIVNGYLTKFYALTRRLPETHPAWKHQQRVPPKYFDPIIKLVEKLSMHSVHAPFRALRKKYKLPSTATYLDEFEGDKTAICDDEEVFPQCALPSTHRFIGPAFFKDGSDAESLVCDGRPLVLASMGSSGNWGNLHILRDSAFECFKVVAVGRGADIFRNTHVEVKSFISPSNLSAASAIICHGGNGTLYQAVYSGVPVLAQATSFEQQWNVERFRELGIVRGAPNKREILLQELHEVTQQGPSEAAQALCKRLKSDSSAIIRSLIEC